MQIAKEKILSNKVMCASVITSQECSSLVYTLYNTVCSFHDIKKQINVKWNYTHNKGLPSTFTYFFHLFPLENASCIVHFSSAVDACVWAPVVDEISNARHTNCILFVKERYRACGWNKLMALRSVHLVRTPCKPYHFGQLTFLLC